MDSDYAELCFNPLRPSGAHMHTIIGSYDGLSPGRRQTIIWINAGILLIGSMGTNFNEISIVIHAFSFKKIHFKMSSGKWRPFYLGLNVLTNWNYLLQGLCGKTRWRCGTLGSVITLPHGSIWPTSPIKRCTSPHLYSDTLQAIGLVWKGITTAHSWYIAVSVT